VAHEHEEGYMVGLIFKLRWIAVVIAFFSALHSLAFIAIGIGRGIQGYYLIVQGPPWEGERAPGIHLARSVDAFLLAMVFFVFSIGVLALFLAQKGGSSLESIPEWMRVRNLSELKFLIWEAILAALVVASVESFVVASGHQLTWQALILPLAILILALGLFLARQAH
jgi:uncharacterized membrane protein YqhA